MKWLLIMSLLISAHCFSAEKQAIIFDYGGVILERVDGRLLHHFLKDTFRFSSDEWEVFRKEWKKTPEQFAKAEFWIELAKKKNVELPSNWHEELQRLKKEVLIETPGMFALVEKLKAKGYRVGMLSNIRKDQADIIQSAGHYNVFDPLLLSCEMGIEKPDCKAYEILINSLGIEPAKIVFIDDLKENVTVAQKLGIDAIHFTSVESLIKELEKRKILD